LNTFDSPQLALSEITNTISERIRDVEARLSLRVSLVSELDQYAREVTTVTERRKQREDVIQRATSIRSTISEINAIRERAKFVAQAASSVRSNIVRGVFSGSLNKVWRDLFVRLAPAEQFVPQFKLPADANGKVEAVLQTVHRSGKLAGTPGAMLSQGNLNTSALTLFLALNLSVPAQLPWLVLDDPVQSMDDVHIAQFAALLRTLSKDLGKQVVVAVHERALFDYLALELSPAFAGDSLITVEISRSFDGNTVADPKFFEFVDDKAVAA
jgi:exonuclease SbcC